MTVGEFAHKGYRAYMGHALRPNQFIFLENRWTDWNHPIGVWESADRTINKMRFSKATFVAIVYPDGSAQLLSRDEDACRLFTTLWELER